MILNLKNVRLSFPDLFTAVPFEPGAEPKYGATFLIPKGSAQHKEIEAAIKEAAEAEWKGKAAGILAAVKTNPQKYCYNDGDTKAYDGYAGNMALTAKGKKRPTVVDRDKSPLTEGDERPYAGCYVNASVEIWIQSGKHQGVRCNLRGVQFVKDGDAFTAGSVASADEFEDLADGADTDDLA